VLRITQSNQSGATTLKLEGKLNRHSVGELSRICLPHLDRPTTLLLDLSAVAFIDETGVTAVRNLMRRSVRVHGCSPLVSNLLKETEE
jgi:anti-anti-sigma factor